MRQHEDDHPTSSGVDSEDHEGKEKTSAYEAFMQRLKADLQHVYSLRGSVQTRIDAYQALITNTMALEAEDGQDLRTLVNVGAEFYCQAEVPNTARIYVDVGLGFHVELSRTEAVDFAKVYIQSLETQTEKYTEKAARIKAHLKLVGEGIFELNKQS